MSATAPSVPTASPPVPQRWEIAVAGLALVLPLAAWGGLGAPFWSPKAALLLLSVIPGAVALLGLVVRRDRAAWAATGFLLVAGLSTALSPTPVLSLVGDYNWGTGWLFLCAVAGLWALGRHLSVAGRAVLENAVLAGGLISAGLGVVQAYVSNLPTVLSPYPTASQGLTGNSAFLGALSAMAMCLAVRRAAGAGDRFRWLVAVALLAAAVQLSGARISLALAVIVAVVGLPRSATLKIRGVVAGAFALGVVLTIVTPTVVESGAQRVLATGAASGSVASSDSNRIGDWGLALSSLPHYAVIGAGPSRYGEATLPRMTVAQARRIGTFYFNDAHNLVLEYAVTTGLLGLAALAAFLALAARRARGALAQLGLVAAVVCLVEPQSVVVIPLALLALGAAGPPPPDPAPFRALRGVVALAGVIVAAAAAGVFVYADGTLGRAATDSDLAGAVGAVGRMPPWPEPDVVAARSAAFLAVTDQSPAPTQRSNSLAEAAAIRWAQAAVDDDPGLATSWSLLGDYLMRWRTAAVAEPAFRAALARNPWDRESLVGLANAETALGQDSASACSRLSMLLAPNRAPTPCPEIPKGSG